MQTENLDNMQTENLARKKLKESLGYDENSVTDNIILMLCASTRINRLQQKNKKYSDFFFKLNEWMGKNPDWNLYCEPPWYQEMRDLMDNKQYD
jgi:hypothetical protein